MRRAWPLVVVCLGVALVACWNFEGVYQDCLATGRCSGGGGDGGQPQGEAARDDVVDAEFRDVDERKAS